MRRYLYAAILLALIASHWWTYRHGVETEEARNNAVILDARAREDKLIADLESAKSQREVRYRDRIITVERIADDCLDRPLPADLIDSLRADSGPAITGIDR